MRDDTDWHFHYPEPGDLFYEHTAFIKVLAVVPSGVDVLEHLPEERHRTFPSIEEFRHAYLRSDGEYKVRYQGRVREH